MRLTVIVPVYNGSHFLRPCLAALARSSRPADELLVVDDASTDDSPDVARALGATLLVMARNGGPARARNFAARQATGDVLVFIDADVCVRPDTLQRIEEHLTRHPETVAVMGSYDDTPSDPGFVSQYKNLFHHFIHQHSRTRAWTFWAGCGAVRRDVYLAAGGFDENYARPCIEDIELGARLAEAGHRIDLEPAIQATHLKRWTLRSLVRTDVLDRAVPWFSLMMRTGRMPPDLNVTHVHRICVALSWLLPLCLAALAIAPLRLAAAATTVAIVIALLVLNRDVYAFFARKRGVLFALRSIPLHWFYYFYCGVGVVLALAARVVGWEPARRAPGEGASA